MAFETPLRYPGGKGKLSNFIKLVLGENGLIDGHYIEPYAGGAGIAFDILFLEYVRHIHINDISLPLYAFWHSVLNDTESLLKLIVDTPVTVKQWQCQKEVQSHPENHTLLELGFSTFFLNRTNRSGILSGGIIGGKQQTGEWKIDARYNKTELIHRITRIARQRERISLYRMDALDFIDNILPDIQHKALVYIDPPYFHKGQDLYENHYQPQDHAEVARRITTRITQKWIVSYDNTVEIRTLYDGYEQLVYGIRYSAAERYEGSETMIFCPNLIVPSVGNPVKASLNKKLF